MKYVLFLNEDHLVLVIECVVEVEEARVVELVHDADLMPYRVLVRLLGRVEELAHKVAPGRLLDASMNDAKRTADSQHRGVFISYIYS